MRIEIKKKGNVVAWVSLINTKINGHIEIEYIKVEKEFRGLGLASKLLNKAKKIAANTTLVAFIDPHPDSSMTYNEELNWFKRHGFVEKNKYDFGDCKKNVVVYSPH